MHSAAANIIQAALGDSGTFAAPGSSNGVVITTAFDVITGAQASDVIKFTTYNNGAAGTLAPGESATTAGLLAVATTTSLTLANNTFQVIQGTYTPGTNFVGASGGADAMVVYDGNATSGATAYEAVVLVGMGGSHTYTLAAAEAGATLTFG